MNINDVTQAIWRAKTAIDRAYTMLDTTSVMVEDSEHISDDLKAELAIAANECARLYTFLSSIHQRHCYPHRQPQLTLVERGQDG